jgi:hypothetical protein
MTNRSYRRGDLQATSGVLGLVEAGPGCYAEALIDRPNPASKLWQAAGVN